MFQGLGSVRGAFGRISPHGGARAGVLGTRASRPHFRSRALHFGPLRAGRPRSQERLRRGALGEKPHSAHALLLQACIILRRKRGDRRLHLFYSRRHEHLISVGRHLAFRGTEYGASRPKATCGSSEASARWEFSSSTPLAGALGNGASVDAGVSPASPGVWAECTADEDRPRALSVHHSRLRGNDGLSRVQPQFKPGVDERRG